MRPRFEVTLRNSRVDSNGSTPARSFFRTDAKNHHSTSAPAAISPSATQPLLSSAKIPVTNNTRPAADSTAPPTSNGREGSAGTGSWIRRASQMIVAMISAWNTNAARQLMAAVIRPPISGPDAAPMPPIALIAPNARARELTSVNSRVVRM
jgi:hypothetical protein